jgi:2-polyprenyl-6-methoxyphenol hydroxylase-like FAD-dependent oxidoreductase
MGMKRQTDVLVAGAGPVGLLAAIMLKRQGLEVTVIDKSWRTATRAYALALHPAALELLDEIGLADPLVEAGRKIETIGFFDEKHRRSEVSLAPLSKKYPFILALPQSSLEKALEAELAKQRVKVNWGHRLAGVEAGSENSRAGARVERLGTESLGYVVSATVPVVTKEINVQADFIFAADGHRSLARQVMHIDYPEVATPELFAVFELAADRPIPSEARIALVNNTTSVLWPLPDGRCRWSFQLLEGVEYGQARNKSRLLVEVGEDTYPVIPEEHLTSLIADRVPWFEVEPTDIRWSIILNFERRLATSYGRDRLWLAGDAVHLASPAVCRSMNVGLTEAKTAADTIAAFLRGDASMDELDRRRKGLRNEWLQTSSAIKDAKATTDADPWLAEHREHVLPCLPAMGTAFAELASGLGLEMGTGPGEDGTSTERPGTFA